MTDDEIADASFDLDIRKDEVEKTERQIKEITGAVAVANATLRSLRLILAELKQSKVVLASEFRSIKNGIQVAQMRAEEGKQVLAELQRALFRQNKEIAELESALHKASKGLNLQPADSSVKILEFVNEKFRRDETEDPE